jgi:hypothetical protein
MQASSAPQLIKHGKPRSSNNDLEPVMGQLDTRR